MLKASLFILVCHPVLFIQAGRGAMLKMRAFSTALLKQLMLPTGLRLARALLAKAA